ncbi:hypothetical protein GUJ93_ZPchr0011g28242 [Zizania palustris]|uniref:Uncharacterized protein n=1 Tax=Zizania palustris TaxID=103762 RepID=A0A8J6BQ91_ZIZPA|nr:hypothetical protein GUJ93_ZPchr0011g28242 [Zizania palustris]
MEEFAFPGVVAGGAGGRRCRIPASLSRRHLRLGLGSSPPPWFAAGAEDDDGDGAEEKMDMLWEDFNEELARTPPVFPLSPSLMKNGKGSGGMMMVAAKEAWLDVVVDDDDDGGGGGGFGFIVAGEQATTTGSGRDMYAASVVRRRRRWSLLLMLRLLKKLFLVNKTRNPRTAPISMIDQSDRLQH